MVKDFLTRQGARFELRDVRLNPEWLAEMHRFGALLPPVTVVDGVPVIGYRPDRLEELLDRPELAGDGADRSERSG